MFYAEEQLSNSPSAPMVMPVVMWSAGIAASALWHLPLLFFILVAVAAVPLFMVKRISHIAILLLFFCLGGVRLYISLHHTPGMLEERMRSLPPVTQVYEGRVERNLQPEGTYLVKLTRMRHTPVTAEAMMKSSEFMLPGDRFSTLGTLEYDPPRRTYVRPLPLSPYNTVKLRLYNTIHTSVSPPSHPFYPYRWRQMMLSRLDKQLGSYSPFAKALLLNDRTSDPDWMEQLTRGGLIHLIAISGLHIAFFYIIFVTLFNVFLPRRASELLFIVLMLAYAAVCQWSAPVMRAIVMLLCYSIAKSMQRPFAPIQIISLSLFIITVFAPDQLFSIGLQLSLVCVIALSYLMPIRLNRHYLKETPPFTVRAVRFVLNMFTTPLVIGLCLLPLTVYYFQRASLNSVLGNIPGIPITALLLPLTFVMMVLPSHWILYKWLLTSYQLLYDAFHLVVEWTAQLPFYMMSMSLSLYLLIAFYLLISVVIMLRLRQPRFRIYALLAVMLCFSALAALPQKSAFTITFYNDDLGDCTLIQSPHGRTVLIDTGPSYPARKGQPARSWFGTDGRNWFIAHKVSQIDVLILTHLHDDHSGGFADVMKTLTVRRVILSRSASLSPEGKRLLSAKYPKPAAFSTVKDTLSFLLDGVRFSLREPLLTAIKDENASSLVTRVDYNKFSALFTGDITEAVEEELTGECPRWLDTDLLKAPHHGSKYSNSTPFIRVVSPHRVIIFAPLHNRFHFPHPTAMQRYRDYGVEPELTGNGTIVIQR